MAKGPDAFRTISEAADSLGVPQHVLRFWETKFSFIRPMKRAGGRRFYRPQDIEVLKGVQRLHKEQGVRRLVAAAHGEPSPPPDVPPASANDGGEAAGPGLLGASARTRLQGVLGDLEQVKDRIDRLLARDRG
ncbi:MAG TPA: MerR family transcriptional regulator [Caulobacteraceae bacterium]|nr:MerR family transcriptional regulator [Caulobacteraceae bacterium]